MTASTMLVEIWSDVACPWCYIAHNRFAQVLEDFPHRDQVEVVQRSFELEPGRDPAEIEPVLDFLRRRYGPDAATMEDQVAQLARADGLEYRTDRHIGSTLDAHRLLHQARDEGRQHELLTLLYDTNFAQGQTIYTRDALLDLAVRAGLDPDRAREVLDQPDAHRDAVRDDEREASRLGGRGVPFFVFDRRHGVTGAQPAGVLRDALDRAWAEHASTSTGAGPR